MNIHPVPFHCPSLDNKLFQALTLQLQETRYQNLYHMRILICEENLILHYKEVLRLYLDHRLLPLVGPEEKVATVIHLFLTQLHHFLELTRSLKLCTSMLLPLPIIRRGDGGP